ncbi:MAG: SOS response-associated peptidase [Kiloniellaceae bacterium]
MCGRYSLTSPAEAVRRLFGYPQRPNLAPRANIAPTQDVAAVRPSGGEEGEEGARQFAWLRWGLIPAWAAEPAIGNRLINARAESVAEKPAFRAAFRRRRCLIAADGFYEWSSEGGGRQPYRITLADGGPFAFAGLWERWTKAPDGRAIETCTIITTEANALLRPIHKRMPVILDPADFELWLDPRCDPAEARSLLTAFPSEALTFYRVSRRINDPRNEDPSLVEPIEAPPAAAKRPGPS